MGPPRPRRRLGVGEAAREAAAGHVEDGLAAVVDARPVPRDAAHVARFLRHLLLHELVAAAVAVRSAGAEEVPVAADGLLGAGVGGDARRGGGAVQSGGGGDGAPAGPAPEAAAGPAGGLGVLVLRELVEERLERAAAGVVGGVGVGVGVGGDPAAVVVVVGRGVDGAAGAGVPQRARALQGQEVPHQRGRRRRGGPRRAAPPPGRAVRVVVAQVDAAGQVRVAAEVVSSAAAAPRRHRRRRPVGRCRRRHCADSNYPPASLSLSLSG